MLLAIAILVALYVGFTLSRPKRPGEVIPTFVWVILFCLNVFLIGLLLPVIWVTETVPKLWDIPATAFLFPVLGLIAGPAISWLILRARREASELDPHVTRMDARRARVEQAKRKGKL